MLAVSQLNIYPIKSLGGVPVSTALITDRGFQYDRRWMLVDADNGFLSQREFSKMATLQVSLSDSGLLVTDKTDAKNSIEIPFISKSPAPLNVQIWNDTCEAKNVNPSIDEWFSDILSFQCKLVYMPDSSKRVVDTRYATRKEITSFSDGYPFLIIGQSSLDDLNTRLATPLPMNRFRPNIVFTGAPPFQEDVMEHFTINNVDFFGVKLCARCVIPTIDQDTSKKTQEPLRTLATYRIQNNNVYFGQNLLHSGEGNISVGDAITINKLKQRQVSSNQGFAT